MKHNIVHFEIPDADVARAKAFYGGLFGRASSPAGGFLDYWMFLTGDPEAA